MSKYDALWAHIQNCGQPQLTLTFDEIGRIAGQAVLAKFAETYFKNKLQAGTPFTLGGAKELLRLGVLTLVIPTGCSVLGSIAEGIAAGFWNAEKEATLDLSFDNGASIVLGVMFLPGSLLCRYGAELTQQDA